MMENTSTKDLNNCSFAKNYQDITDKSDNSKDLSLILKMLCKIYTVDYAFISLINKDLKSVKYVQYVNLEKFDAKCLFPDELDLHLYPWFYQHLKDNCSIQLHLQNGYKKKQRSIEELLILKEVHFFLALPIFSNKELIGYIGLLSFNSVENIVESHLGDIKVLSLIISKILENIDLLKKKENLEIQLDKFTQFSNDIIISMKKSKIIKNVNEKPLIRNLGYKSEDLIGFSFLSILHNKDFEKFENSIQQMSLNNENSVEIRIKNKEGHWHQFDCRIFELSLNSTNYLVCVLTNIEQRKWIELKYKNLFENSPNAILIIDFKGVIIDANRSTQNVFGYEKDFFIGKSLEEFDTLFPFEIKNFYKETFQAFFKNNFPRPLEIQIFTKSKNKIWLEVQGSVIKHEKNIFLQLLFQNIDEKKKRELLELEFKEKLEQEVEVRTIDLNFAFQQQKKYLDQILKTSQFKTEFMSTMSHELRTPLNAIIGFTDLLLEEVYGPLTEEQRDFVNDIKISAEDQFDMIKNILNISKIESGQIVLNVKSFSLNSMVEQTMSSLKPFIGKKRIEFQYKGLDREIEMRADPIKFKEILLNLLSNAVKFTIEGTITFKVFEKNDKWEFEVSDTGIGIEIKDFPLIFKDFKRVDSTYVRSVPGTGLGLSLTKRLVELHGGEITFFSVLGVGTTFCFSITKKIKNLLA